MILGTFYDKLRFSYVLGRIWHACFLHSLTGSMHAKYAPAHRKIEVYRKINLKSLIINRFQLFLVIMKDEL